ncbi:ATP-dependent DNA helicase RecQ [Prevotella sp. tf2-5]|uniref:RecQ family ATP-dependent DNA helicase n=1 Tax=Prevotella sp. tf2-5 TaxID=1761889 RepID=UPI0008E0FCFA|nr:ATP-dependent DNA helicase RecQ [Prevotella sp. tf2-5]SFO55275.1 ATP-dependent DNA helicase RecQ [Prevotella sp. tf2-5]
MSNYQQILKQYWGYDDFRGIQREIIESVGAGHDTLGLMPTGGGKSITFQVPALAMEGVCIVITPLIALMKDQVHHLRQRGIMAAAVYSGMQRDDILRVLENCILGNTKLLYVSPERLGSELFQTKLKHMQVSFITVDEAHCISQWGYDFRPSYLQIADIRRICPDVPVLALTATATPKVVEDICERLSIDEWQREKFNVFRMSFERKNLTYLVSYAVDKRTELIQLLEGEKGAAIVYVRSRRHAREIAEHLTEAGLSATFYHAGLEHAEKDKRQRDWQHDRVRIMVATNAFGMGIDKPDVRIVAHYDLPDSIEAYFQEAGRAGRDGQPARAVLLYNNADEPKLIKRVSDTFPEKDYIRKVYDHLAYYYQIATGDGYGVSREFNIDDFCHKFNHFPIRVHSALQILQRAGYIEYTEEQDNQARVKFLVTRDDLYRLRGENPNEEKVIIALLRNYGGLFADYGFIDESMIANQCGMKSHEVYQTLKGLSEKHVLHFIPRKQVPYIRYMQRREDSEHVLLSKEVYEERLTQYKERIEAMLRYAKDNSKCRSRQLLEYFGEKDTKDCGQCDVCHHTSKTDIQQAKQQILTLLSDRQRHHVTELLRLQLPKEELDKALTYLLQEEYIMQKDGYLIIP